MSRLHDLAREAGLLVDWEDADGERKSVTDESIVTILAALGIAAGGERAIANSRQRLQTERREAALSFCTANVGRPVELPAGFAGPGRARLLLECGEQRDVMLEQTGKALCLPAVAEPGYHRLEAGGQLLELAIAPRRAYGLGDVAPGRAIWAPAVQIPSLRDARQQPFGDFAALAGFAGAAVEHGADAIAISPVHALFPADPSRYSPYAPSTRLFLNVLLADPAVPGYNESVDADSGDLIDWQTAIPRRLQGLRRRYELEKEATLNAVNAFRLAGGEELERHARYDMLHAHFFRKNGSRGWQEWPANFRDPNTEAVADFVAEHRSEVEFYLFLQWLADRGLADAQGAARDRGMAVGLIADLATGIDAGGSYAWSRRGTLLRGLSLGAPPDRFAPGGQDWGITSYAPGALRRNGFQDFIATVRVGMRHAGGIRLDHAMGLRRLWVVPEGAGPAEGAYLRYPESDLMRLLALESWRARAIVIGEDLGTVPAGFRETLDTRGILGMRVLWFERGRDSGFLPPAQWSRHAAAMTGTHDLPTVAGWWQGRDIDWTWALNRPSRFDNEQAEREARAKDRARLWSAFRKSAVATGPEPSREHPDYAVDAAVAYVAGTSCDIAIVPAEDLLGLPEQPNLPGTVDEYPNWRRRLPRTVEDMLDSPRVAARIQSLNEARRR